LNVFNSSMGRQDRPVKDYFEHVQIKDKAGGRPRGLGNYLPVEVSARTAAPFQSISGQNKCCMASQPGMVAIE
jgi:hypothetical protein